MAPQGQKTTQAPQGSGGPTHADNATQAVKEAKKTDRNNNTHGSEPVAGKVIDNLGEPSHRRDADLKAARQAARRDELLVVSEDVAVAFYPPNSTRKSYIQAFAAGSIVTRSDYDAKIARITGRNQLTDYEVTGSTRPQAEEEEEKKEGDENK